MNKDYILFHLSEARSAVDSIMNELKSDPKYEYGNYRVDIEHVYHHINTAWNARDASRESVNESSEQDFNRWCQFPVDLEILS
jgi:hypothetical protein